MISKVLHHSRSVSGVVALVAVLALPAGASAGPGLYPDLRMLGPTELHQQTRAINGVNHYLVNFTTVPWNDGEGALEVHRTPTTTGLVDITQRIYEDPAGFHDEWLWSDVFNQTSMTFRLLDIARYELWTERAFVRAQARGFTRGQPLYVRDNISHCVADATQRDPDSGPAVYRQCTAFVQGLSVGWGDIERWFATTQSVDFGTSPPPDGDYVIRVIVDPNNRLFESPGKQDPAREGEVANSAISYFSIVNGQLAGTE